ncbi:MAG: 23S rRNA (uracil(1939)-C(5))-methyltransferase RlmD, partial [Candidatus Poribacteria bacterium]|nr:23S rRNA (uracil(1939)-C(5))-methyltransferase RlmD [Candidatus Poribacteria bacterium]
MVRRRKKKLTYAERKRDEVLESGLDLAEPECAFFGECGGCSWQSVRYERQLEFKREWIERAFHDNGLTDVKVPTPIPSPRSYGYRNKMEFSFAARRWLTRAEIDSGDELDKSFALGLHAKGAFDRVLDIDTCPIQSDVSNAYLDATRAFAKASEEEP